MNTTDELPAAMSPWDRYVHLMECRHFNRMAGSDPEGRRWERQNAPEIERLEATHPDFVMAYCKRSMEAAQAAAPMVRNKPPTGRPKGYVDRKSRQYNDG